MTVPTPRVSDFAMKHTFVVHPSGLDPFKAVKAWHLRQTAKLSWREVRAQVRTASRGRGTVGNDDVRLQVHIGLASNCRYLGPVGK